MARIHIVDEVDSGLVTDVLTGGGVSVAESYTNYFVNSGTASAVICSVPCLLHTVNIAASALDAQLMIGDAAEASAVSNDTSAGLVAKFDLCKRGTFIFDTLISNTLTYRLTGLDCDGITITYQIV